MKTCVKLLGSALAIAFLGSPSYAADINGSFSVLGAGTVTCQKYLDGTDQEHQFAETWVAGYVTAANRFTPENWSLLGKVTIDELNDKLHAECSAHPTDLFAIAVNNVLEQLFNNRTKQSPG
jgi:hypothetical protein